MHKEKSIIKARRKFIKRAVNSSKNSSTAITKLAKRLYLSESTIYKDLKS